MSNQLGQVKVPREFFAKSKSEYSDWLEAFFREIIQNALDAGAKKIEFSFLRLESMVRVTCIDNGHGMSRHTLTDVLLALGGSEKQEGAIGGFGYAKSLLFFAHRRYNIRTHKWSVTGEGGTYTLKEHDSHIVGTTIQVDMDDESVNMMESKLTSYCSRMNLDPEIHITLYGQRLRTQFTEYDYLKETTLGTLLFREVEGELSQITVSVRGLPMFVQRVWATQKKSISGVLELRDNSLEMLTANRDSLKGEWRAMLDRLIQSMVDNRFAFKAGRLIDITLNRSAPALSIKGLLESAETLVVEAPEIQTLVESLRYMENVEYPRNFNLRLQHVVGRNGKDNDAATVSVTEILSTLEKGWIKMLARAWKHATYTVLASEAAKAAGIIYYRDGGTKVLEAVTEEDFDRGAFYYQGSRITTGFLFARGEDSLNTRADDGSHIIFCNPLSFDKKFYVGDLLDLAIRECSHIFVRGFNEDFADTDLKFRRSFRRLMTETVLKESVKVAAANHKALLG